MKKKIYIGRIKFIDKKSSNSNDVRRNFELIRSLGLSEVVYNRKIENESEKNPEGVYDNYRILRTSIEISKDENYLSAFLLKESSLIAGKIDEKTTLKDEERAPNDVGVTMVIDLNTGLYAHYSVKMLKFEQFNIALENIINKIFIKLNNDLRVETGSIKHDEQVGALLENLKKYGHIKKLKIEYLINEEGKEIEKLKKFVGMKYVREFSSDKLIGLNIDNIQETINEVIEIQTSIVNNGEELGEIKIYGETWNGKSFGNDGKLTFEIDEKNCKMPVFLNEVKDIFEDYKLKS